MSLLYHDLFYTIGEILAQNGETSALDLLRMTNKKISKIRLDEPLIFEYVIVSNSYIGIPISLGVGGELYIDWGDGITTVLPNTEDMYYLHTVTHHTYNRTGVYRIKVYNKYRDVYIHIGSSKNWADNISDFITLGRIGLKSLDGMFMNTRFNGKIGPNWDTTTITDLSRIFGGCRQFNQKLNWNTENVTDMSYAFNQARRFNQRLNWDTSNVTDMSHMFGNAVGFNQPFGKKWNTSKVIDMSCMFGNAIKFNQKINFDTPNVRKMISMFMYATSFNQTLKWDVRNVRTMRAMFYRAKNFNQALEWDTENVVDMSHMFSHSTNFNQRLIFNTRNVRFMNCMFENVENFNQPIDWDIRNVKKIYYMFYGAKRFNQSLNWVLGKHVNIDSIFGYVIAGDLLQMSPLYKLYKGEIQT